MGSRGVCVALLTLFAAACGEELTPSGAAIQTTAPATTAPHTTPTSAPKEVREVIHDPTISSTPDGATIDTTEPGRPSSPSTDPFLIEWLAPTVTPDGLQLVGAERSLIADCGPMADCAGTLPSATLRYDTDDLSRRRSLDILQRAESVTGTEWPSVVTNGEQRQLGGRSVLAAEQGADTALPYTVAEWTEPSGPFVQLTASGLTWDELDNIVSTLTATDPTMWPNAAVQDRASACVDAHSQYAPTVVPDGWVRFVLQIQPTGTCDVQPFLFMSLVVPGTDAAPGKLVSFTVTPTVFAAPQPGDAVSVNGHEANLRSEIAPDGQPASQISFTIDAVAVEAHGNVDGATLQQLASTVGPISNEGWAELVAERQA